MHPLLSGVVLLKAQTDARIILLRPSQILMISKYCLALIIDNFSKLYHTVYRIHWHTKTTSQFLSYTLHFQISLSHCNITLCYKKYQISSLLHYWENIKL